MVGVRENFEKRPIFYFQNNLSPAGRFLLLVSAIGHDTEMHATPLERLIFQMSLDASQKRNVIRLSTPSPGPPPPPPTPRQTGCKGRKTCHLLGGGTRSRMTLQTNSMPQNLPHWVIETWPLYRGYLSIFCHLKQSNAGRNLTDWRPLSESFSNSKSMGWFRGQCVEVPDPGLLWINLIKIHGQQ